MDTRSGRSGGYKLKGPLECKRHKTEGGRGTNRERATHGLWGRAPLGRPVRDIKTHASCASVGTTQRTNPNGFLARQPGGTRRRGSTRRPRQSNTPARRPGVGWGGGGGGVWAHPRAQAMRSPAGKRTWLCVSTCAPPADAGHLVQLHRCCLLSPNSVSAFSAARTGQAAGKSPRANLPTCQPTELRAAKALGQRASPVTVPRAMRPNRREWVREPPCGMGAPLRFPRAHTRNLPGRAGAAAAPWALGKRP
jgi:hypothetical protein